MLSIRKAKLKEQVEQENEEMSNPESSEAPCSEVQISSLSRFSINLKSRQPQPADDVQRLFSESEMKEESSHGSGKEEGMQITNIIVDEGLSEYEMGSERDSLYSSSSDNDGNRTRATTKYTNNTNGMSDGVGDI